MHKVRVCVELPDPWYRALEDEAQRRGVTVPSLVESMVQNLLEELEHEEDAGTDHLILPS